MRGRYLIAILCLVALLCGCGGTEKAYNDGKEQKEGPGLFSGKDGVFTILNKGGEDGKGKSSPENVEKKEIH